MIFVTPPAEKRQNFFGVFLQFQIGVDTRGCARNRPAALCVAASRTAPADSTQSDPDRPTGAVQGPPRTGTTTKWSFRALKKILSNHWGTSLWSVPMILGQRSLRASLLFFIHNILTKRIGLAIIGNAICKRCFLRPTCYLTHMTILEVSNESWKRCFC